MGHPVNYDTYFLYNVTDINRWTFEGDRSFGIAMTSIQTFLKWGHLAWPGDLTLSDLGLKISQYVRKRCMNRCAISAKNLRCVYVCMYIRPPPIPARDKGECDPKILRAIAPKLIHFLWVLSTKSHSWNCRHCHMWELIRSLQGSEGNCKWYAFCFGKVNLWCWSHVRKKYT